LLVLTFASYFSLSPQAVRAVDQNDPSIVGVWLFDEGAGTTVTDVVNGNNATLNGTFNWNLGVLGNAIEAVGGGSIDVPDSPSLTSFTNALTVAAWVRVDADSDTGIRKQGVFLMEDQSASEPVPNAWSFRVWTSSGLSPGFYGTTQLAQGQWYHVAGTYDGTNMELYINGVPESLFGALSDVNAPWIPQHSGSFVAGSPLQLKYGSESFTGAMDEVMIFNRALSNEEIFQVMQGWASLAVPEPSSFALLSGFGLLLAGARRRLR
jgi:hypothetical protein